ncbi:MAG: Xaa-Pro peptidase family protein [Candidatus Omnitrophota bacterium]
MRSITKEGFHKRIRSIQEEMERRKIDAIMVYGDEYRKENLRYVSNFWPIFERASVFIGRKGDPILAGAPEGEKYAREMAVWDDYRNIKEFLCVSVPEEIDYPLADFSSLREILGETMGAGKKLGLAGSRDIPHIIHERILKASPAIEIVPADDILEKMRLIKSESEVLCLKEAGRLAGIAYEELLKNAVPGQTELYATGKAEGAARSAGAEGITFTVFGSGQRTNTIIGRPTEKVIEDGDMMMVSIAVQYEGYVATAEFPFVAGKMSEEQKFLIGTLIEATNVGLPYLKAGKPMQEFVRAVRNVFRKKNLAQYDIYPPLHGCGLAEAESPYPDEDTGAPFQAGMTVNTDISLFGHPAGSNRIEEGFVITEKGMESLTPLIQELTDK